MPETLRLLFVGINPGLMSAATGLHFAYPGNRFYPALRLAGILPGDCVTPGQAAEELPRLGIGITNLVARASARASQLDRSELRAGRHRLEAFAEEHQARVVAIAGITSYRVAFAEPAATPGRQENTLAGAELWVVPNPSGLNAHETVDSLAAAYRAVAVAAGVQ